MSSEERTRRHMEGLRRRVQAQLADLGIDVGLIPTDDRAVIRASEALRALHKRMAGKDAKPPKARGRGRPPPPRWHSEPTPERVAHATGGIVSMEVHPGQPRVHAVRWAADVMAESLTSEEYAAAKAYADAFALMQGRSPTVAYGSIGGGGYRGLEPTERQVAASATLRALERHVLHALGPIWLECARNFLLEIPMAGQPRTLTWVEFGRLHGRPGDDGAARWLARGALKATCSALAAALSAQRESNKRSASAA